MVSRFVVCFLFISFSSTLVDLFYLKTCSFRQAKPIEETIFCSNTPEIRYHFTPCQKSTCSCCRPLFSRISSTEQIPAAPPLPFYNQGKYQFLNGYQTILNCPAVNSSSFLFFIDFSHFHICRRVKQRILSMH